MASKSKRVTDTSSSLARSVEEMSINLDRLTKRLLGDEDMQLKGLTHEVGDLRSKTEDGFTKFAKTNEDTTRALERLNTRLDTLEEFRQKQESFNKQLEETRAEIEKGKNIAFGGWKALVIAFTLISSCSGVLGWAVHKYLNATQPEHVQTVAAPLDQKSKS